MSSENGSDTDRPPESTEANSERLERPFTSQQFRALLESIEDVMETQRTVLRLVDFISARAEELDDIRSRLVARMRTEYPGIDEQIVTAFLDGMDAAMSGLSEMTDDEGRDEAERHIVDKIERVVSELPEGYSPSTFILALGRAQVQAPSTDLLHRSLLVTLVGNFELQVATAARTLLELNPASLHNSERTFTWREVAQHDDLEAFRKTVIEKSVDDLMRESAQGWFRWFERKFGVATPTLAADIGFREVLQRRHIVVHNGGVASRLYIENLPDLDPQPELDAMLDVDEDYLRASADALLAVCVSLIGNIARKVLKDSERSSFESILANMPYRMIQDERHRAALHLCNEFAAASFDSQYIQLTMTVNRWLAMKRLGHLDECIGDIRAWDTSILSPEFQLARLALLDELDQGLEMVKKIRGTEHLSLAFWLAWPLLAELREYESALEDTANDIS